MSDILAINKIELTAEDKSGPAFDSVIGRFKGLKSEADTTIASMRGGFAAVAGIAATLGAGAFAVAIAGVVEMQAQLLRLAQSSGASVEALSAMRGVARDTGTDIASVAKGMEKFAKSIVEAQSGAGKASEVLTTLGFNAKTFATQFESTDQALLAVAKRLNEYEDGIGKTAAAQALLGKSGAELLPFLAELAERGTDAVKVTTAQARVAEDLTRAWHELGAGGRELRSILATAIAPALDALVRGFLAVMNQSGGVRQSIRDLAADGTLASWARQGAILVADFADKALDWLHAWEFLYTFVKSGGVQILGFVQALGGGFLLISGNVSEGLTAIKNGVATMKQAGNEWQAAWGNLTPSTKFKDAVTTALINIDLLGEGVKKKKLDIGVAATGIAESFKDITAAIDAYEKSVANLAKANIDAIAKGELVAIKSAEAELERSYSRGLVSFEQYWDQKTALQARELGTQQKQISDAADEQQKLVDTLRANLNALDGSKFKTFDDFLKAMLKTETDLNNAEAALAKTRGDLSAVTEKAAHVGDDYLEVLTANSNGALESVKTLNAQIKTTQEANEQYGLTASQIQLVIAARNEEDIAQARARGASEGTIKGLEDEIAARQKLSAQLARGEDIQHQIDLVKSFDSAAHDAFSNILSGGTDTFKKIGESLKKFVIDVLYELTVKKWIISVGASLTGVSAAGVANATGSGGAAGDVSNLLSTGSSVSSIGSLGSLLGGTGLATSILGAGGAAALGGGFTAGLATLGIAAEAGTAAVGGLGVAVGALGAVAIPVVGWIAAIGIALWTVFGNKGGGPKAGGFASTDPAAQRFFTPNNSDADLAKIVGSDQSSYQSIVRSLGGTAGNFNFGLGFDTDPKGTANNRVSAGLTDSTGNSLYSVRDRDVGRDDAALQAAVTDETARLLLVALQNSKLPDDVAAIFNAAAPAALSASAISDLISGVTEIHNGLVALGGDGSSLFGVATSIQDVIDAAKDGEKLTDTWTRLSSEFLATDAIANVLGHDMGTAFGAIGLASTDAREQMIGFVGGLQNLADLTNSYYQNFFTAAERQSRQVADLGKQFDALGVSMPATRAEFRHLVESQDLATEAGRQMVASLLQLAPAYAAAITETDSLTSATNSLTQAQQQAIQSAKEFFDSNFYSDAEKQAKAVADAQKQIADAASSLGIGIPQTVAGFRQLIEGIDQSTDAGKALYNALIVLAPAVFTLGGAATTTANQISQAAAVIQSAGVSAGAIQNAAATAANTIISNIQNLASASTGTYGDKQGLQANLLKAQADEFARRASALLQSNGGWEDAAVQQLETTSGLLQDEANKAVDHLARYTVLSAQYSSSIAEQLVALQDWNTDQAKLFRGNADALAALATITDAKWKAIVEGTSTGVTGTIDQLQKLRDSIATYLTGLLVSDKSVLTPEQKLASARTTYQGDLALAQGGDQDALGRITQDSDTFLTLARQFYASSANYTGIFNDVAAQLRDLAIPPGTAPSTSPTIALQNALPAGKLASSADISANTVMLGRVLDAINTNTAVTASALDDAADKISSATDSAATKTAFGVADAVTTQDRR